jgi:hypothetical protein
MTFAYQVLAAPGTDPILIKDLEAALAQWSAVIDGQGTLAVALNIRQLDQGQEQGRSQGNATTWMPTTAPAVNGGHIEEPSSLYELRTGQHAAGTTSDITIDVDPDYLRDELYLNPNPGAAGSVPADKTDAVSALAHEIGHGLGMVGQYHLDGTLPPNDPYITQFDNNVRFIGGKPFFIAANAEAVYGGPVPLTFGGPGLVPNYSQNIYHLANSDHDYPLDRDLMTGTTLYRGTSYPVSPLDAAIVKDDMAAPAVTQVKVGSGVWTIDAPKGVDPNDVSASYDESSQTLTVTFDFKPGDVHTDNDAHFPNGIEYLRFTAPPPPAGQSFGYKTNLVVQIKNDLGVAMNGFGLFVQNDTVAQTPDKVSAHPTNYAHVHGITSGQTFGSHEVVSLRAPDGSVAPGGAADPKNTPAASEIQVAGDILPGDTLISEAFTLHNEEVPGQDNGFWLSLTPSPAQSLVPPALENVSTFQAPVGPYSPFTAVSVHDTSGHPDKATITVQNLHGMAEDNVGVFLPDANLTKIGPGKYELAATTPQNLTTALEGLNFNPLGFVGDGGLLTVTVDNGAAATTSATTRFVNGSPPPGTASANNTIVTGNGTQIRDAQGHAWSLIGDKVAVDGTPDATTGRVVALAYEDGKVWQQNQDGLWWAKTASTDAWTPTYGTSVSPVPAGSILPESPDAFVAAAPGQTVVAGGHAWTFLGGQVVVDGKVDGTTANVVELAYKDGKVWQENASHLWWSKAAPADQWSPADGTSTPPLNLATLAAPSIGFMGDPMQAQPALAPTAMGLDDMAKPALALRDFSTGPGPSGAWTEEPLSSPRVDLLTDFSRMDQVFAAMT